MTCDTNGHDKETKNNWSPELTPPENESDAPYDCISVERHFRGAMEFALDHTPPTMGIAPVFGAAFAVADSDDTIDREACEMIATALEALITRHAAARENVRAWHSLRCSGAGSKPDAIAILDIAAAVQRTANLYRCPWDCVTDKGTAIVEHLRECLARVHGEAVPSVSKLEEWMSVHTHKSGSGKLTTAGIVSKIIHHGRLLGAHTDDESVTLCRVDRVLSRASKRQPAS